jgi:hypothetical protein
MGIGQPIATGVVTGQPGVVGGPVHGSLVSPYGSIVNQAGSPSAAVRSFPVQAELLPYSYWASAPKPARVYVGYGAVDQFPFHGRPYGSPNDRWSWYNLGGGNSRYLAKYYYPPLR